MNNVPLPSLIAIITDFGDLDPYVGIMKGVISKITPGVQIIDITHNIPPGDIKRAAINLWQASDYFPIGTVFLIVVDPGVGTARRGLIIENGHQVFVGPDNGVFSFILGDNFNCWDLSNRELQLPGTSATFHGRDIFAPAAAYACKGVAGSSFGSQMRDVVKLPSPLLQISKTQLNGEILLADQFGNLLTSLGFFKKTSTSRYKLTPWLGTDITSEESMTIDADQSHLVLEEGQSLKWFETFAEIPQGECGLLVGSSGLLEIAANGESAANILNSYEGEKISLKI